jgi:hypothetical protein
MDRCELLARPGRPCGGAARAGAPAANRHRVPRVIRRFCYANGINFFRLIDSQGATEAAPGLGYADMVADIAETGTTLHDN